MAKVTLSPAECQQRQKIHGFLATLIASDYKRFRIGCKTAFLPRLSWMALLFSTLLMSASGASFLSPAIKTIEITKNNGIPMINAQIPIDHPLNKYSANISVTRIIEKKTTMRIIPNQVRTIPQISSSSDLLGGVAISSTIPAATKSDHHITHFRVITRYALCHRFANQLQHCRQSWLSLAML